MKALLQNKKILIFLLCLLSFFSLDTVYAASNVTSKELEYIEFREIDRGTYNEYRYRMTEKYFELREGFEVDKVMKKQILLELSTLAKAGYNYLPDNLANKNLYSQFETHLKQGLNNERSDSTFNKLVASLQNYIEDVDIFRMTGGIEVTPKEGNAPLNTTLRANISDPTGVEIPSYNYVWWIDTGGNKKILGRGSFINYTFTEEGNYSIFLGVKSNHKNTQSNTDVLPYFGKADIRVKEKVASVILKVNSSSLGSNDELKFDSEDAKFGLLFDATSSTPNSGMKFTETSWDFGNGITRKYEGAPKVERVTYVTNGSYKITLTLKTNSGKVVTRNFTLYINHPAASIRVNQNEGYIGDKFTFSSKSFNRSNDNVNYSWEIIDINNDEVIHTKNSNLFNYVFTKKGRYNVKLRITLPSGEEDVDTKIIYINSRPPQANFTTKIPQANKPNTVFLDGSKSYDPDVSDDGKLNFTWTIDGERAQLTGANKNGSVGYYVFDSIGEHSISLEVIDPDNMPNVKTGTVEITSLLDVDFQSFPTAIQRDGTINFSGSSQKAKFYEWDFGDGIKDYGSTRNIQHVYEKSGSFLVTLTVTDEQNNSNKVSKNVFVGKSDSPVAIFDMTTNTSENLVYDQDACGGRGAYISNKLHSIKFDGKKSIDLDGKNTGLSYSWKIGLNKYETSGTPTHKFDELGCFPIKLTVISSQNKTSDAMEEYVEVRNILPTLSSLTINSGGDETDPIIFNIKAIGAKDADGVIQSYLWYYYTDYDTEAQGFKTTPNPETSFVLPKITGTYYFGVVLKDNNEDKFLSEDIGKFFRTISSDNSNTPLIELKVNDNSVAINDEIVFTAKVKNIIGKDLSDSAEYYWDFDGDGFFEKKGTSPTVSYKYKKSGTFYPKLKVKYRGLSNVRNLTVDVVNKLEADFDYISIGNKFIFLDKSQGKVESATWNFGDDTTSDAVGDVVHEYDGSKRVHKVTLTIREGTKKETIEKEVVANMKNILKARKTGVNLFSSPIIANDIMKVADFDEKATIYPGESNGEGSGDIQFYAVDYDIETDSDLNGGKDDDRDNINTPSYRNGTPLSIDLNGNKSQKVRVFTLDASEKLINSYDFIIEKDYIVEEQIDLDSIVFEGATDNEKEKIEKLKSLLSDLPTDKRLPAMKFVQKLQGEWFDARGKTDVIVEMQMFLSQIPDYNPSEVNELLESFLVEDNADKGERGVAFNALKNLIPSEVTCDDVGEYESCNDMLTAKLEAIKNSTNLEENKKTGSEILDIVGMQGKDIMSDDSKLRFKEVLKTFVYGGVSNIPDDQKPVVIPDDDKTKGVGLLKGILYAVAGVLGLILLGLIGFFVFYKLNNKDKNIEFQDFIIEKTNGKDQNEKQADVLETIGTTKNDDALASISFDEPKVLKTESTIKKVEEKHIISKEKQEKTNVGLDPFAGQEIKKENTKKEEIPKWLGDASNTSAKKPERKFENNRNQTTNKINKNTKTITTDTKINEEVKKSEGTIPDWLKGAGVEKKEKTPEIEKTNTEVQKQEIVAKKEEKIIERQETKKVEKQSSTPVIKEKTENFYNKKEIKTTVVAPGKQETKKTESGIPDWLKGSGVDNKDKNPEVKKENIEIKKEEVTLKKETIEVSKKPEVIQKKQEQNPKKKQEKTPRNQDLEELTKLDDGIPDWLKGSLDIKKPETVPEAAMLKGKPVVEEKVPPKNGIKLGEESEQKTKTLDNKEKTESVQKTVKKNDELVIDEKSTITKTDTASNSSKKLGEGALWQDGMEIPDWLKDADDNFPEK